MSRRAALATSATPSEVRDLFRNCRLIGRRFRLAHVVFGRQIIATATEKSHVDKIRRVGADAIVNPGYIGGLRMVSEMLRPMVVRFLDDMLRDRRSIWRIEEATVEPGSSLVGSTLAEAAIRNRFGMTVLALSRSNGPWIYNPDPNEKIVDGTVLVVLGSVEQVAALRAVGRA